MPLRYRRCRPTLYHVRVNSNDPDNLVVLDEEGTTLVGVDLERDEDRIQWIEECPCGELHPFVICCEDPHLEHLTSAPTWKSWRPETACVWICASCETSLVALSASLASSLRSDDLDDG